MVVTYPRSAIRLALLALALKCLCPDQVTASTVPSISVSASPSQVSPGSSATFTLTTSRVNRNRQTKVNFSTGGTAVAGRDYTLSGTSGQAVIRTGASS